MSAGRADLRLPGPKDLDTEETVALIRERSGVRPSVAVVLGSGLGDAVQADIGAEREFSFEGLPGFPRSSVPGHDGQLIMGTLYGVPAAVFMGRVHYYEGHGVQPTTLVPRVAAALGARTLVLTNAAGGLDPAMNVGDLMIITDHINLMGVNPLFGWWYPDGSPAFVDLSAVYDHGLVERAREAARSGGIDVREGVYAAVSGPSYETPAEIVALGRLGANAVGMSTVPEAVAGVALGLKVMGISCITDVAGGEVTHEEVLAAAGKAAPHLRAILAHVIPTLDRRMDDSTP